MPRKRVLPYTFPLTDSDWHEIWNCCDENIQNKLPVDGFGTTEAMQQRLSEADWIQVYLSVQSKLKMPSTQGNDNVAREWRHQLRNILETLAAVRETFIGPAAARRRTH